MMNIKNNLIVILACAVLGVANPTYAKYYRVRSDVRLNYVLENHDLVVALVYNKNMGCESVKRIFKELSRGYSYQEAGVAFVGINVAREEGADIARMYGVQKTPALLLFESGHVVLGKDRVPAVATDLKSVSDMRIFINGYFGDRIEDELREMEERDMRRRKQRWKRSGFHFGISYGYPYYPYYGYPFGYSYGYPIYMGG